MIGWVALEFLVTPQVKEKAPYVYESGISGLYDPGPDGDAVRSDDGARGADGGGVRARGVRGAAPVGGRGDRRLDRRVRGADGDELRGPQVGRARDRAAGGVRDPAGGGGGADALLVRIDRPADPVAVGRGGRAGHRGIRRGRVHDAAGSVGDPPVRVLRADRAADLRDRADLYSH